MPYQDLPYCPTRLSLGPQPYSYLPDNPESLYDRGSIPHGYDPRTQRISFAPLDTLIRLSNESDYNTILQHRMSTVAPNSGRDSQFQNRESLSHPGNNRQSLRGDQGLERRKSNLEDRRRLDTRMVSQNGERKHSQPEEQLTYQTEDPSYFENSTRGGGKGSVQNISRGSLDMGNIEERPKQRPSRSPSAQLTGANGTRNSIQGQNNLQNVVKSDSRIDLHRESMGERARKSSSGRNIAEMRDDAKHHDHSNMPTNPTPIRTEWSGSRTKVTSDGADKTHLDFRPSKSNLIEQKRASEANINRWRRASALALEQAKQTRRQSKPDNSSDNLRRSSRERFTPKDPSKERDSNRLSTAIPGYDLPYDFAQDYYRYGIPYPTDGRMSYAPRPSQAPIDLKRLSMFPHPDNWGPARAPKPSLYPLPEAYQFPQPLHAPYPSLNPYSSIPQGTLKPQGNELLDLALMQSLLPTYALAQEPRGTISAYENGQMNYSWLPQPSENCAPPVMPAGDPCVPSSQCPCCGAIAPPAIVDPCCAPQAKVHPFQNEGQAASGTSPVPNLSAAQMTQLIPGCTADGTQFFILPLYSNMNSDGTVDHAKDKSADRGTDGERRIVCCKKKRPTCRHLKCSRKFDMKVQGHACKANGCSSNNDCWCCPCKCNPCSENGCSGFSGGCS